MRGLRGWSPGIATGLELLLSELEPLVLVSLLAEELSDEDSESLAKSSSIPRGRTALPCFRGCLPVRFLRGGVGGFGVRNSASFFFSRASLAFWASLASFFLLNMAFDSFRRAPGSGDNFEGVESQCRPPRLQIFSVRGFGIAAERARFARPVRVLGPRALRWRTLEAGLVSLAHTRPATAVVALYCLFCRSMSVAPTRNCFKRIN